LIFHAKDPLLRYKL
jgi:hypothetical protein